LQLIPPETNSGWLAGQICLASTPRDINDGLEAGFFAYITKPIKNNELVEALDVVIASKRKEQESAKI
jgi:AmiR/NasT family two-component response regulator